MPPADAWGDGPDRSCDGAGAPMAPRSRRSRGGTKEGAGTAAWTAAGRVPPISASANSALPKSATPADDRTAGPSADYMGRRKPAGTAALTAVACAHRLRRASHRMAAAIVGAAESGGEPDPNPGPPAGSRRKCGCPAPAPAVGVLAVRVPAVRVPAGPVRLTPATNRCCQSPRCRSPGEIRRLIGMPAAIGAAIGAGATGTGATGTGATGARAIAVQTFGRRAIAVTPTTGRSTMATVSAIGCRRRCGDRDRIAHPTRDPGPAVALGNQSSTQCHYAATRLSRGHCRRAMNSPHRCDNRCRAGDMTRVPLDRKA
jgi:hypothetical protein